MHHKTAIHVIIQLVATILTFLWVNNPSLSPYALQVSALMLLFLVLCKHILKAPSFKLAESVVATITILMLVGTTGAIRSPLFFLNYLLLFCLSLLIEPILPIILSGAFITFYLLLTSPDQMGIRITELIAFPLMTPLAYFLGSFYQKVKNQRLQLQKLSQKVEELEEEVVEDEIKLSQQKI
jgi:hypothetical protein